MKGERLAATHIRRATSSWRCRSRRCCEALASVRAVERMTQTRDLLQACRVHENGRTPSVETLFHAGLLSLPGVHFIGHTHITSVNSLTVFAGRLGNHGGAAGDCSRMKSSSAASRPAVFLMSIPVCRSPARSWSACGRVYRPPRRGPQDRSTLQNHGFIALGAERLRSAQHYANGRQGRANS